MDAVTCDFNIDLDFSRTPQFSMCVGIFLSNNTVSVACHNWIFASSSLSASTVPFLVSLRDRKYQSKARSRSGNSAYSAQQNGFRTASGFEIHLCRVIRLHASMSGTSWSLFTRPMNIDVVFFSHSRIFFWNRREWMNRVLFATMQATIYEWCKL